MPKYSEYLLVMLLVWLTPDIAYAQNSISNVLCEVGSYIWGPVGSLIAVLGVISIGLIAMFGKIQISSVLTVMTGIAIVFGARGIMDRLGIPVAGACGGALSAGEAALIVNSQFYTILGCLVLFFIGPVGKTVATVAMILLGIFASFGRISWHQAMLVAVGIATMFGAVSIVQSMGVPVYTSAGGIGLLHIPSLCSASFTSVFAIEAIFCNVVSWFTGAIGKGLATISMIILGIGALFGKVSWGMAMVVALGVAMVFGSTGIIEALGAADGIGVGKGALCETINYKTGEHLGM